MIVHKIDYITKSLAARCAACLDIKITDILPPLWHWALCLDDAPAHDLGPDGHRARGGLIAPDPALPARMWAGGRIRFFQPLAVGMTVQQESRVIATQDRQGRSGHLRFITVQRKIFCDQTLLLKEEQDLVYRAPQTSRAAPPPAPQAPPDARLHIIVPNEIMLFRYSALTFNSHRIHYDLAYAQGVENYPGLVVHGPLQATLLAAHVYEAAAGATMHQFEYRSVAPAFVNQPLQLEAWQDSANPAIWHAQTRDPGGAICTSAKATFTPAAPSLEPSHD